jgi:HlyD family secretion protein
MKVRFRSIFWIVSAVVVLLLLALAFRPQPVLVEVAKVTRGTMQVMVRDEGRTRVRDEYVVSAPVGGRLLRIPFKPGAVVEAGETVARVLPSAPAFLDARAQGEAQAAVRAAEAALAAAGAERERAIEQLAFARTEAERVESLRARELVSAEAYDRAQLELRAAHSLEAAAAEAVRIREAELQAATIRLTQPGTLADGGATIEIPAPISGRVLRVTQESESVIGPGAEIMTLGNPEQLEVVVEMLSTDAVQVRQGAEVVIENWDGSGTALGGRVRLVEPYGFLKISALGVEEQRVNVVVDFTGPPSEWSMLGHGYRVEAAVVTWGEDNVLKVPVAALFRHAGRWAVMRVDAGRARLAQLDVGRNNGEVAQVLSGIDANDTVILYPGDRLGDGVAVKLRNVPD